MKKWLFLFIVILGFLGKRVEAGDEACTVPAYPYCYDYTIVNQWACETCPNTYDYRCIANTNIKCYPDEQNQDPENCGYENPYCYETCVDDTGQPVNPSCQLLQRNVQCNTSPGYCSWTGQLTNCRSSYGSCTESSQITTKSCCGCPNPPCDDGGGSGSPTPPPACEATYPSKANLTSPTNNSTVAGSSITLQWQAPNSWGVGCPENDNRYLLNVWDETANTWVKDSEGNDYNHKIILPPTTSETVPLSGLAGHTISWRVIADNGTYENDGDAWNFQVAAGISGTLVTVLESGITMPHSERAHNKSAQSA